MKATTRSYLGDLAPQSQVYPPDTVNPAGDVLSAFVRLVDRDNMVSLVALRAACGLHRWEFDAELRALRVADVLCLSGPDRQVSQAESDAAIREQGDVLLYAHRR